MAACCGAIRWEGALWSVLEQAISQEQPGGDGRTPVWIWWDYAPDHRLPGYLVGAQKALLHFAPKEHFDIRYVNRTNVWDLLPDFPREVEKVYMQAVSDAVRAGLLAKYGGVYMDSDMFLAAPLKEITDRLKDHDMVTYTSAGQDCKAGSFSSNFMAARKGSRLHAKWYEKVKLQLKNRCPAGDIEHIICCYEEDGSPRKECHVPWGGLGEGLGHPTLKALYEEKGSEYKVSCFDEKNGEGFAPCVNCLWASTVEGRANLAKGETCRTVDEHNLQCNHDFLHNFWNRRAYHLFSSIEPREVWQASLDDLVEGPWVFSGLIHRTATSGGVALGEAASAAGGLALPR